MPVNLLITYYVLKELIYQDISTIKQNLHRNQKMPDQATLPTFGKRRMKRFHYNVLRVPFKNLVKFQPQSTRRLFPPPPLQKKTTDYLH